ncbi:lipase [Stylonychia lemnae]|uniref:Lipase n=1 Tax=Stylonychia lemnae TaxID=5949 RepID=A0A078AT53_STYLE|nr:lipase [Stylonychia lemnae]|eukprot:CDW84053.1 lipase [Stylonychia lemnae]
MKSLISLALISILAATIHSQNSTYKRGLTDHFIRFLDTNKDYYTYNFNRTQFFGGSFGGKENDSSPINKVPVVFVHGAADMLIGYGWENDGFRYDIEYFLQNGYTKAEIYGSMWGYADIPYEYNLKQDTEYVLAIRKFMEAVLDYTGAPKIDVISHSMGVTLSRAAIKGGKYLLKDIGYISLKPINKNVRTYIGIAGVNYGVLRCQQSFYYDNFFGCNKLNGFYPGNLDKNNKVVNESEFLHNLNNDKTKEGDQAYAMLSLYDNPLTQNGKYNSAFPTMDMAFIYNSSEYTHLVIRDKTSEFQLRLLNSYHPSEFQETEFMFMTNSEYIHQVKVSQEDKELESNFLQ